MSWFLVFVAALFEVIWAIGLKYSDGFSRPVPTVVTVIAYVAALVTLGLAVRDLPIGTAYAVWVGFGIAGTAILGVVLFGEPVSAARVVSLGLLLGGVVGLLLTGRPH